MNYKYTAFLLIFVTLLNIFKISQAIGQFQSNPPLQGGPDRNMNGQGGGIQRAGNMPRGPWNGDLTLYHSEDGINFKKISTLIGRAGVPSLSMLSNKKIVAAFQWFPLDYFDSFDKVAVSFSIDQGKNWSIPQSVIFHGMPQEHQRPFDPTLVALPDGKMRMYFTSTLKRPMAGPHDGSEVQMRPQIMSALSEDGINFQFEAGIRFGVEGQVVIDCAVVYFKKEFHLYAPIQEKMGMAYHAISEDGLNFKRVADINLEGMERFLGNVIVDGDKLIFYGTGRNGKMATSDDGVKWALVDSAYYSGADPGVVKIAPHSYFLLSTGPENKYPLNQDPKMQFHGQNMQNGHR